MDCQRCSEELTAYLDGELLPQQAGAVAAHLEACPQCREDSLELKRTGDWIRAQTAPLEPSPQMWNNLRARIHAMPEARNYLTGPFRVWLANRRLTAFASLAAAAAIVVGLWGYWGYLESRRLLERYMSEYIQQREAERGTIQGRAAALLGARAMIGIGSEIPENPFVVAQPAAFENPFRSGAR